VLADKLSREIVAKDQLESRKARQIMSDIRNLAIQRVKHNVPDKHYLEIQDSPIIFLPVERKLGEKPELSSFTTRAEKGNLVLEDLEDLSKIYAADLIDKKELLANIYDLLESQTQVSLQEVVKSKGLDKGLAELLSYIVLLNTNVKFFINENERETIQFNQEAQKYLDLPQIIFTK